MKAHIVLWAMALLALCVIAAVAADAGGKWIAQVPGRGGETQEQVFVFKVEGSTLTGTISTPRGEQAISEGKVSGEEISFVVVRKFQDREMRFLYKGKVSDNEIKFTREMQGGPGGGGPPPQEFTAKRAGS